MVIQVKVTIKIIIKDHTGLHGEVLHNFIERVSNRRECNIDVLY
jgi:hypothetical protein